MRAHMGTGLQGLKGGPGGGHETLMEEAWPLPSLSSLSDGGDNPILKESGGQQEALPRWSLMEALGKTDFVWCFSLRPTGLIWLAQEILLTPSFLHIP